MTRVSLSLRCVFVADANPRKKGRPRKVAACLDDRYPVVNSECSNEEVKSALDALSKEISNAKPRKDIFLPLMKTTFSLRRHYIMHDALSVQDILREYPAMKQVNAVRTACCLIVCIVTDAIIMYCLSRLSKR